MDFYNSDALIATLKLRSKTPSGRLLGVFDALADTPNQLGMTKPMSVYPELLAFCTKQARALGANQAQVLAEHILLIAINASMQTEPQTRLACLKHGRKAAHALIMAQTHWARIYWLASRPLLYGMAASVILVLAGSLMLATPKQLNQFSRPSANLLDSNLTAKDASLLYAKYEQMRQGTCQYPEALQIPDQDKAVYLENVVGGKLPTNLKDLAIANHYLEKVRCNFTPKLMANSTS
ncbi:MAG: hypothetical protein LAC66_05865 [Methylotenera sp.]|nr:hypothetical protein [Methylotenera sp.]